MVHWSTLPFHYCRLIQWDRLLQKNSRWRCVAVFAKEAPSLPFLHIKPMRPSIVCHFLSSLCPHVLLPPPAALLSAVIVLLLLISASTLSLLPLSLRYQPQHHLHSSALSSTEWPQPQFLLRRSEAASGFLKRVGSPLWPSQRTFCRKINK